jgi:hypothetical protein
MGIERTAVAASRSSSSLPPYSISSVLINSASVPTLARSSVNLPALVKSTTPRFSETVGERRFISTVTLILDVVPSASALFSDLVRLYLHCITVYTKISTRKRNEGKPAFRRQVTHAHDE